MAGCQESPVASVLIIFMTACLVSIEGYHLSRRANQQLGGS